MLRKRFSIEDWVDFGLSQLAAIGPQALTIDALCIKAGKTKGSFYFHFPTMQEFHQALADTWFDTFTMAIIDHALPKTPRTDLLNLLAVRLDLALETGIRNLAVQHTAVQATVTRADQLRVEWLAALYHETGRYDSRQAHDLAKIEYAAFTGFRLIDPGLPDAEARKLYQAFLEFTQRA